MRRNRSRAIAVPLTCAVVVLAGCSSSKNPDAAPSSTVTVTATAEETVTPTDDPFDITLMTVTPTPSAPSAPAASSAAASTKAAPSSSAPGKSPAPTNPPINAGRVFAFLKSVDLGKRTITYDEAQFFTGAAAKKAAADDNRELDTDYYIRNINKRLRTLPVSPGAAILGSIAMSGQVAPKVVTLETLAAFVGTEQGQETGFWVTIKDTKTVTRVQEQYLP